MAARYSDDEIAQLVEEPKPLADDYQSRLQLRDKRGHKERELEVIGAAGTRFGLILRQSLYNPLDFSVIVGVWPEKSNVLFRLRRYNGKSHEHTNRLEGDSFVDFHVHLATERYQELGMREDAFAEPTNRYGDLQGALNVALVDCGFQVPDDLQGRLFEDDQP